ncbi:unnamed protein product [Staurois parvus]|uniref:Uncharacterized protein n=1 Tax=Staurois parvus TaxID=386267 RepID=A0ABN9CSV4_9NEOB|nr:unnamed protein product [Staurois parvus]
MTTEFSPEGYDFGGPGLLWGALQIILCLEMKENLTLRTCKKTERLCSVSQGSQSLNQIWNTC